MYWPQDDTMRCSFDELSVAIKKKETFIEDYTLTTFQLKHTEVKIKQQ